MTSHDTDHKRLHKLLRGEIAAVDSYESALRDVKSHPARALLESFLEHHRRAVAVLTRHVANVGEEPDRSAGPWGAFARAVEKAASWVDDPTTLKALKEGEVHGVDEYRTALAIGHLPDGLPDIVSRELLPAQLAHVQELDVMIGRLEQRENGKDLPERVARQRAEG